MSDDTLTIVRQEGNLLLSVEHMIEQESEGQLFRATVVATTDNTVRIQRTGQPADTAEYAVLDSFPYPVVGDEVLVARVGQGWIVLGHTLRAGLTERYLTIDTALNILASGRITIGDLDPATNGGGLIDITGITFFDSVNDGQATLDDNGLTVVSEGGDPFFKIRSVDGTIEQEIFARTTGFGMSIQQDLAGRQADMRFLDQVLTAGTSLLVADTFGAGAVATGMLMMVHCFRDDTGADLGHIFGAVASAAGARSVSTTNTDASSSGTTAPTVELASDGILLRAHASFDTRFYGLILVGYD